jgi:hypothetical protein
MRSCCGREEPLYYDGPLASPCDPRTVGGDSTYCLSTCSGFHARGWGGSSEDGCGRGPLVPPTSAYRRARPTFPRREAVAIPEYWHTLQHTRRPTPFCFSGSPSASQSEDSISPSARSGRSWTQPPKSTCRLNPTPSNPPRRATTFPRYRVPCAV